MGLEERKLGIVACDQTRFKQACSFTERLARIMSYCLLSFCSNGAGQNKRMYSLVCLFINGVQQNLAFSWQGQYTVSTLYNSFLFGWSFLYHYCLGKSTFHMILILNVDSKNVSNYSFLSRFSVASLF